MEWKLELDLSTKTILTRGSEFLMAWTSWSRTRATTRRTTTTSRKPPGCSSKNLQDLGLMLSQKIIRQSLTQCQNNWVLFFVMVIYLEKMMERLNSGDGKMIFGTNLSTLNIGLMKVEEYNGKRRRKQEQISILYWSIRTRNSLSPSSSRSFRTQWHWSFILRQCISSERFHRVHLSHGMCNQFTLHREFRTDTRRTKFEQKTDGILHVYGSNEQGTQRSWWN